MITLIFYLIKMANKIHCENLQNKYRKKITV